MVITALIHSFLLRRRNAAAIARLRKFTDRAQTPTDTMRRFALLERSR